jgi:hypothetical protein
MIIIYDYYMPSVIKHSGRKSSRKVSRKSSRKVNRKTSKKTSKKVVRKMSGGAKRRSKKMSKSKRGSKSTRKMTGGAKKSTKRKMKGGNPGENIYDRARSDSVGSKDSVKAMYFKENSIGTTEAATHLNKATSVDDIYSILFGINDPTNLTGKTQSLKTLKIIMEGKPAWSTLTLAQKKIELQNGSIRDPKNPPGPLYVTNCSGARDKLIAILGL